jgi:hypothetical protein
MSTIFEKLAVGQTAFTSEVQQGGYIIDQALGANEPTALHIMARFQIYRASYSRPAANTTLTYGAQTAYFDNDDSFTDLRGGLCEFTRHWYTIPATWQEPGGTFAYTFPSYVNGIAWGSTYSVTGIYQYNTNVTICNTSGTFVTGVDVYLDVNYLRSNQNFHVAFSTPSIGYSGGAYFSIANVLPGHGTWSSVTGTARGGQTGRSNPETIEVDSILQHDYALADPVSVDQLLPQIDKFSPTDSSGNEVDRLSTGTATTPNSSLYQSMITAGTLIVARRSDRRKYAGNIWERTTLLVKAR